MRAMSRGRRGARLRSRGQALVELSLAAVMLVTLVVGSAQVALLYYDQMSVSTSAREAAVIAAENPANTGLFTIPTSPTSHTCTGTGDAILACAAAYNSTHNAFGGLITTSGLSVSLAGGTYAGSSPVVCTGYTTPSDGTVTVTVTYNAPIFVPFIGAVLATPGQSYRTMTSNVTVRVEPCDITKGS